jgi:CubicO group peptidase (beta-lactamase class C family)
MKLLRRPTFLAFFLTQLHYVLSFQSCPLLGVEFPTPTNLSGSSIVQSAASTLLATINNAINVGVIDSNASSFSVEIFLSQETTPLFTFHHSSPGLISSVGVKTVDSNSIYRIGSVSKLFTIYLLLIESGDIHFHEPITNFVPELLAASRATPDDDLDYVDWSSVTIGNLASHMAGIGRDCMFCYLKEEVS